MKILNILKNILFIILMMMAMPLFLAFFFIGLIVTPIDYIIYKIKKYDTYKNYEIWFNRGIEHKAFRELKDYKFSYDEINGKKFIVFKNTKMSTIFNIQGNIRSSVLHITKLDENKYQLRVMGKGGVQELEYSHPFKIIDDEINVLKEKYNLTKYQVFYVGRNSKLTGLDNKYIIWYKQMKFFISNK